MRPLIRTDVPELEPALRGERHEEVHRRAPLFALGLASALLACTWLLLPTRAQSEVRVQAPVELTADGTRVVQLFGDMPVGRVGPDGRPVPQSEEIRQLMVQDFGWKTGAEAGLQCTIDVVQAVAYLGQAVVFLYHAAEACPEGDDRTCGVSVAIVLTSFAWIASYVSLAAESCKQATQATYISTGAICAADVTGLTANLLELVSVGQAVGSDCDFGPEGPWAQALHDRSSVEDLWKRIRHNHTSAGDVLEREYKKLGLLKKTASGEWVKAARPAGDHSKVFALAGMRKRFGAKKVSPSPVAMGRRLGNSTVSAFLDARRERLAREQEQMARNYDIASCVFDVTQSISYIVRATFQIHSSVSNCPDPTACSVDILNIISSFAWLTQFTALAVGDCAVESYQGAYCAGDIADMVAAVTNGAAIGMSIGTDCAEK